jgi:hypothetical protein
MNFFFDANISYRIANMVAALCEDSHRIVHITQHNDFVHNNVCNATGKVIGNKTPDLEWIPKLGESNLDWKVISGDMDIIDTAHERAMLLASRVTVFACDHNWAKLFAPEQAWKMVKLWEEVVRHAQLPGPALYRFHAGRQQYIEVIKAGMRARGGRFRG